MPARRHKNIPEDLRWTIVSDPARERERELLKEHGPVVLVKSYLRRWPTLAKLRKKKKR